MIGPILVCDMCNVPIVTDNLGFSNDSTILCTECVTRVAQRMDEDADRHVTLLGYANRLAEVREEVEAIGRRIDEIDSDEPTIEEGHEMFKHEEVADMDSCLNKAGDDEMIFVLLGRDLATPETIRFWVEERIRRGLNRREDMKDQKRTINRSVHRGEPRQMISYTEFVNKWSSCTACDLCKRRKKVVLGRGTTPSDVVFVAEAPGFSENVKGYPMVGQAGHLFDYIVGKAVPEGITYSITNLVCCIPLDAEGKKVSEPEYEHVMACSIRLKEFIAITDPRLIVCVGKPAKECLDQKYKGAITFHKKIPMVDIVHPAYIQSRVPEHQKGLIVQRAIVVIRDAVETYILNE